MIDLKLLRSSPAEVRGALARRGDATVLALVDEVAALDERRREATAELDRLNAERNAAAKADAQRLKGGALPPEVVAERRSLGDRIATAEREVRTIQEALEQRALYVPNLLLPELPDGDATQNRVVRAWGEPAAHERGRRRGRHVLLGDERGRLGPHPGRELGARRARERGGEDRLRQRPGERRLDDEGVEP